MEEGVVVGYNMSPIVEVNVASSDGLGFPFTLPNVGVYLQLRMAKNKALQSSHVRASFLGWITWSSLCLNTIGGSALLCFVERSSLL